MNFSQFINSQSQSGLPTSGALTTEKVVQGAKSVLSNPTSTPEQVSQAGAVLTQITSGAAPQASPPILSGIPAAPPMMNTQAPPAPVYGGNVGLSMLAGSQAAAAQGGNAMYAGMAKGYNDGMKTQYNADQQNYENQADWQKTTAQAARDNYTSRLQRERLKTDIQKHKDNLGLNQNTQTLNQAKFDEQKDQNDVTNDLRQKEYDQSVKNYDQKIQAAKDVRTRELLKEDREISQVGFDLQHNIDNFTAATEGFYNPDGSVNSYITGPIAGTIKATWDKLSNDPKRANAAIHRLLLEELKVDDTLLRVAQTKGAISNSEMKLFMKPAPDVMLSSEKEWIGWIEKRRAKLMEVQYRLRNSLQASETTEFDNWNDYNKNYGPSFNSSSQSSVSPPQSSSGGMNLSGNKPPQQQMTTKGGVSYSID